MTVLTLLHPMAPITTPSSTSTSQQQQKIPLRRATYIHISDLTSAYNIDNIQLEKEMSRVNAKRNKLQDVSSHNNDQDEGSKDDDGKTGTPDEDPDLEVALGPVVPQKRLQPPRGGFNLCILVGKIKLVVDKSRVDGSRVRLAEVEIGDETGTVSLRARDDQIDLLERVSRCKPGAIVLRNCTLELYQGKHIRLAVTKWGKLSEYPDNVASTPGPPPTMNLDRNFSLIDLSLVASEIIEKKPKDSMLQSHTSASRQTKTSEGEKASGSGSSSKASSTSKSGQQTHTKNQQQSQSQTSRRGSNRSSNERRQSQSRGSHYGGMTTETNQNQPPRQQGQVVYHGGIQGYHGYEQHHQQQQQQQQSIDMRMRQHQQYPPTSYTHSTRAQQDAVSAQYALRQQYEMQQRQLHQLYSREQNRQSGLAQQPAQMLLRPISSFEASTGSYAGNISEHHQHHMMTGLGNSPMMVGITRGNAIAPSSLEIGRTSPFVIGQMNPEAMSYAPSYQGSNPQQQVPPVACPPQYNYDPSRQLPDNSMYPQHTFYAPATMYPHTPQTNPNHPMDQEGKASIESALRGKENVTSKS